MTITLYLQSRSKRSNSGYYQRLAATYTERVRRPPSQTCILRLWKPLILRLAGRVLTIMSLQGSNTHHRRPAAGRQNVYVRPRRSSPLVARSTTDHGLVFEPGGEAAIIPTQGTTVASAAAYTQEDSQTWSRADAAEQTGLFFSTEVIAVMGPDTETTQVSAQVSAQ